MISIGYFILFTGVGLIPSLFLRSKSSLFFRLGESFFLGILSIIVMMNLVQTFNLMESANPLFYFSCALAVFGWTRFITPFKIKNIKPSIYQSVLLIFILFHLILVFYQNSLLPLTPWDAWLGWVAKAKIWHFHGFSEEMVSHFQWSQLSTELTNPIHHYPDGLPLLYVFNSYFVSWNEPALNSIYSALFVALLFVIYDSIKMLTKSEMLALIAVFVFSTLPFVNVHILMAGYADIWVAAFLFLAFINAQLFIDKPEPQQFLLFILFSLALILFKLEGWIWLLLLTLSMLLTLFSLKQRLMMLNLLLFLGVIWFFIGGFEFMTPVGKIIVSPDFIQIPSVGSFKLAFVNTSYAWFESLYFSFNWHLLFYSVPFVIYIIFKVEATKEVLLPLVFLSFATLFLFFLFYFTLASVWVNDFTSSNRIILQLIPTYIGFSLVVFGKYQVEVLNTKWSG